MPQNTQNIPLNDLFQDPRVQQAIRKRARELAKMNIDRSSIYTNQITACHAWLLTLHYRAINQLRQNYYITKPQFLVLLAAYFMKKTGNGTFKVKDIQHILLEWQHGRVYKHLDNLTNNGYMSKHRNKINKTNYYSMTSEGEGVVRAFSQHYRRCIDEVWDYFGELPKEFWP
jgi:DNA-binding MarR family transcriptional regulator